jgi:predicted  nucleic acid-binding Zn-ribbon protein
VEDKLQYKLKTLLHLQKIDLRLEELEDLRGDLPQKVENTRSKLDEVQANLKIKIQELKDADLEQKKSNSEIKQAQDRLKKYQDQLYRVSTNREYDALTLEIDGVKEEIDRFEYRILELYDIQEELRSFIKESEEMQSKLSSNLDALEKELHEKLSYTNREEENLRIQRQELTSNIDRSMYGTYERVRKGKNGIAVVATQRNACGGCFNAIPPQRLLEIREKKKFITCEFCGRILVWDEEKNNQQ